MRVYDVICVCNIYLLFGTDTSFCIFSLLLQNTPHCIIPQYHTRHQAAILYNLKARHLKGIPYTRTGDIVIAVNPFEWHMDLYAPVTRRKYAKALVWERNGDDDPRKQLPPHVYEASCLAYRGLASEGEDQSILVSGESGAGKTETVKILMGDIASVQQGPRGNIMESADQSTIVQRVLDSNPLLEAFGNAKTLRNDNSSRFGKYIQLQFDGADTTNLAALSARSVPPCKLVGSKCEVYLLEKSRVVSHVEEERTFHIFYQLLAAPEETKKEIWEGLADTDNESFEYVGWSETDTIEGKTDQERFQLTIESLKLIGVTGGTLTMLMRTLCIVLQLGNLEFAAVDDDSSKIADQDEFEALVKLTGIGENDLRTALLLRNMEARSETFQVPLSAEFAKDSADAFAKEIYAKTFLWLVRTINDATCAEKNYEKKSSGFGIIGLLDIFGFETFEVNRFEQLCINYANEKLQAKFTSDIFQSVMAEYEFEGIELGEIVYDDNSNVLDLVEGRMGLLAFLNEECVRPKGADKTFVYKAKSMNQDNPCLFPVPRAHECEVS
jgi:myosin V